MRHSERVSPGSSIAGACSVPQLIRQLSPPCKGGVRGGGLGATNYRICGGVWGGGLGATNYSSTKQQHLSCWLIPVHPPKPPLCKGGKAPPRLGYFCTLTT